MKKILILSVVILTVCSCQNKREKALENIRNYEKSDSALTEKGMLNLANLYMAFVEENPSDSLAINFKKKAAEIFCLNGNSTKCSELYIELLGTETDSAFVLKAYTRMGTSHYHLGSKDSALMFLSKANRLGKLSTQHRHFLANLLIDAGSKVPADTVQTYAIYNAARQYHLLNLKDKAIDLYNKASYQLPKCEITVQALYLLGNLHNDYTQNYDEAKKAFTTIINEFPDHPYSQKNGDARLILDKGFIGKTAEEIFERLKAEGKIQ